MFKLDIGLFQNEFLLGGLNLVGGVLLRWRELLGLGREVLVYRHILNLLIQLLRRYRLPVRIIVIQKIVFIIGSFLIEKCLLCVGAGLVNLIPKLLTLLSVL